MTLLKHGDIVKIKYIEDGKRFIEAMEGRNYNRYLDVYYKHKDKKLKIIQRFSKGGHVKFKVESANKNIEYDGWMWFDSELLEKYNDFKDKIKFVKELL